MTKLAEAIKLPIEIGDTILTGKFRNHRQTVDSIEADDWGHPTINGKTILKVRIAKLMNKNIKEDKMNRLEKLIKEAGNPIKNFGSKKAPPFKKDEATPGEEGEVAAVFEDFEEEAEDFLSAVEAYYDEQKKSKSKFNTLGDRITDAIKELKKDALI